MYIKISHRIINKLFEKYLKPAIDTFRTRIRCSADQHLVKQ